MEANTLAENIRHELKCRLQAWAEGKIDTLCSERPRMKCASVYLKRGLRNWLHREEGRIGRMTDTLLLFVTDENGRIDAGTLKGDLMRMFREMDVEETMVGVFPVAFGKGEIKVTIPRHPLADLVFGELGEVRITASDLEELLGTVG